MTTLVRTADLHKEFHRGGERIDGLQGLNLEIPDGDFLALMGPSGSGKTTLLNLLGGLDRPTQGAVEVGGDRIDGLSGSQLAQWRARHVGFVFQLYNLLPVLTAERNVELPLLLTKLSASERKRRVLKKIQYADKISLVSDLIQEYIVGGQLKVGMELPPEREFAQQLGVSRFSLREALRVAQVKGLIEITRGRKPRVAKPTTSAASEAISLILRRKENVFIELVEARQILECQIARLAASRVTNEQISRMRESIKRLEQDPDNIQLCVAKDFEFHEILIEAAGNRVIQIKLEPLSELLKESRFKTIQKKGINRAVTAHKAIRCAINERYPDRASEEMHWRLKMAKEDLLLLSQFEDAGKS